MNKILKSKILSVTAFMFTFIVSGFFFSPEVHAECNVTDAKFRTTITPNEDGDGFSADWSPGYPASQQTKPYVYMDIKTEGCGLADKITVNIFGDLNVAVLFSEVFGVPGLPVTDKTVNVMVAPGQTQDDIDIAIPLVSTSTVNTVDFTAVFRAGEDFCGTWGGSNLIAAVTAWVFSGFSSYEYVGNSIAGIIDCSYYFSTEDPDGDTEYWQEGNPLKYECYGGVAVIGACDEDWTYEGTYVEDADYVTAHEYGYTSPLDIFANPPPGSATPPLLGAQNYLAPLPGLAGQEARLGPFLQGLFNVLIIIAGILAFIMIVIGAIEYLTSDAISGHSHGREMMLNAVLGLVLALGAWIILNTINPRLAENLNITVPSVNLGNYNFSEPGVVSETTGSSGTSSICKDPNVDQTPNCPTCIDVPPPVNSLATNHKATPETANKLVNLQQAIPAINWTITEGFPPSRPHCAREHYTGKTVDVDFIAPTTENAANIRAFIDAAKSKGLQAQFETSNAANFNAYAAAGLKKGEEILLFPSSWISGSHFSVYNR